MRIALRTAPVCLGLSLLLGAARAASAQTYVWTDERGVVHAASEPSEVPERYRAKAVQDAQRPSTRFTVVPPPDSAAPAASDAGAEDPTAPAPMKPGYKPQYAPPPAPPAPLAQDAPKAAADDEEAKKKGLGDPAPGFEWHCTADPEGGKPKCEQFEKRSSKRARHAAARAEARKKLGVSEDNENDPETRARLDEQADKEYEKTTVHPNAKPKGNGDSDDDSEESETD